jgi:hypothetical protein
MRVNRSPEQRIRWWPGWKHRWTRRPLPTRIQVYISSPPQSRGIRGIVKELFDIDVDASHVVAGRRHQRWIRQHLERLKSLPVLSRSVHHRGTAVTLQALGSPMKEEAQRVTLRGGSNDQNPYVPGGIPLGLDGDGR